MCFASSSISLILSPHSHIFLYCSSVYFWEVHVVLTVVLRDPPCQQGSPFSYTIWLYWFFAVPAHIPHFLQDKNKRRSKYGYFLSFDKEPVETEFSHAK